MIAPCSLKETTQELKNQSTIKLYLLLKHCLFTACKRSFSKTEKCTHCCREGAQAVVLHTDGQSASTGASAAQMSTHGV
jgi:hypothetical protein